MFAIYQLTNLINNKKYIGVTTKLPPEKRFYDHIKTARNGSRYHLHKAIRKYGKDKFLFEVLEIGENEDYGLNVAEPMYVVWMKPEYNMTGGGNGTLQWTEDAKARLKKPKTEEHKRKLSLSHIGKKRPPFSESWKENMRKRQLGVSPWNKGKTHSPETKLKISYTLKENYLNKKGS